MCWGRLPVHNGGTIKEKRRKYFCSNFGEFHQKSWANVNDWDNPGRVVAAGNGVEVVDGAEVTVDVSCPACQEEVAAYSPQPTCITDPEAESVNQNSEAITPVNEELPPFIQEIVAVGKTPTYR